MSLPRLHDGFAVFTQEETRLIRATATLLVLPRGTRVVNLKDTLPVYEGERKVGAATLFVEDDAIKTLISLDYETPERLNLDIGEPVYANFKGYVSMSVEDQIVDCAGITGIGLSIKPASRKEGIAPLTVTRYDEIEE